MAAPIDNQNELDNANSTPSSQPIETPTKIGVLHIPHSEGIEHPTSFIQVPLVKIGSKDISEAECTEEEKQLGYLPDIRAGYSSTFCWERRILLEVPDLPEHAIPQGVVCKMYVCIDEESGLPHNKTLESLETPLDVFGDAFVFKMESKPTTGSGGARFLHKDENFVPTGRESMVWKNALWRLWYDNHILKWA